MHPSTLSGIYEELCQAQSGGNWQFCADLARQTLNRLSDDGAAPELCARFQILLGRALSRLPAGDRGANLEEAIVAVEGAMALCSLSSKFIMNSDERAQTKVLLANLYLERKCGDRTENRKRALSLLGEALRNALARQDLAERADAALKAVDDELRTLTREGAPFKWANALQMRGALLSGRVRGGRAENQEETLATFALAQEVLTPDSSPQQWALCMLGRGMTLAARLRGDRRRNLEAAAVALTNALEVFSQHEDPVQWCNALNSLGIVYAESARAGEHKNLDLAIDAFHRVLMVLPRDTEPEQWGMTTRNLGLAYLDRSDGNRSDNVEKAIDAFNQALSVFTRRATPIEWAETLLDLGLAYQRRLQGDGTENRNRALSALQQALELFTADAWPSRHALVQRALGHPSFDDREWANAYDAYAAALSATGHLYRSSVVPDARQLELRQSQGVPARAAYALAHLDRTGEAVTLLDERASEAVTLLEQQAAQSLSQTLARNEAAVRDATDKDREAFSHACEHIEMLEAAARREGQTGDGFLTVVSELRQAHEALREVAQRIAAYVPQFMPERMLFSEITELVQELNQPLVYLITTSHGSLAFVLIPHRALPRTHDAVIWLDHFTVDSLTRIMLNRPGGELGYLRQIAGAVEGSEPATMMQKIDEAWTASDENLMRPIAQWISDKGYERAFLIARGELALLPLHVVSQKVYFSFAPSARALRAAHSAAQNRVRHPPTLLGIANPLRVADPLYFAAAEIRSIANHFDGAARRILEDVEASRAKLLEAIPGATHIHFACHGLFDPLQPLMSWLGLAGEDRLTLLDVLDGSADLSATRLVVLSACQTGLVDFEGVPSEAVGFPAAFLQAGVPGVISALWPVDDISTSVLMEQFYQLLLKGDPQNGSDPMPAPEALRRAQDWIRNATACEMELAVRFDWHYQQTGDKDSYRWREYYLEHPKEQPFRPAYYWAGFTYTGL